MNPAICPYCLFALACKAKEADPEVATALYAKCPLQEPEEEHETVNADAIFSTRFPETTLTMGNPERRRVG